MTAQYLKTLKMNSAKAGFQFFSRLFPERAAKVVYSQMFVPAPFRFKQSDLELLKTGEFLKLQCQGFHNENYQIATWSWSPEPAKVLGQRILLVHGWAGAGVQFKSFVTPLLQEGFHVTLIDLPAHGHSTGNKAHLPGNAHVLLEVLEHFNDTRTVVAHSFGATATCIALSWGAQLNKVVLFAPMADVPEGLARTLRGYGATQPIFDRVRLRAEESFNISWSKLSPVCFSHELSTPALIIHDRDDHDIAVTQAERLQMMWPKSKLLITEGLGHFKILRNKELINKTIRFIKE